LLAKIYSIPQVVARKRVADLSHLLRCENLLKVQLRRLSLGERMKMEIIGALLHAPRVLFLDEPTIGLDVLAQATIREFISQYVREFKPTVILTSHYMDDIARLADQLLLISQGRIVYNGTVDGFVRQSERQQRVSIRLASPVAERMELPTGAFVEMGAQELDLVLPASLVGAVMTRLTQTTEIQTLSIEESDFEDVIHRFLEKESRPL
ncbi:MAG: ATP-binding cassette domain-containing protein, partial [Bdellovibrionales bacterium]|nr:ATP-binding cassette domain-containing protein [Bdellovibrionales bacterium]